MNTQDRTITQKMKKSSIVWNIALIGLIGLYCSCDKGDSISAVISGQVIDAYTKDPVTDVKVLILESGPFTYSDDDGNFEFMPSDLAAMNFEEVDVNGFWGVAVLLSHEDYRPQEANVNYSQKIIFKLNNGF